MDHPQEIRLPTWREWNHQLASCCIVCRHSRQCFAQNAHCKNTSAKYLLRHFATVNFILCRMWYFQVVSSRLKGHFRENNIQPQCTFIQTKIAARTFSISTSSSPSLQRTPKSEPNANSAGRKRSILTEWQVLKRTTNSVRQCHIWSRTPLRLFTAKFDSLDEIRFVSIRAGHHLCRVWPVHGLDISRLGSHFCLESAIFQNVVGNDGIAEKMSGSI